MMLAMLLLLLLAMVARRARGENNHRPYICRDSVMKFATHRVVVKLIEASYF
jgi:hypothetical protein